MKKNSDHFIRLPLCIVLVMVFSEFNYAQNLVPNPSFEMCVPQCTYYENYFNFTIQNWFRPNGNSSDLYSTLLPKNCELRMPRDLSYSPYIFFYAGKHLPRTGTVLGGFFNEARLINPADTINNNVDPYREYFAVKLISPLVVGKTYYASMYISLSETSLYLSNNIGMYFTEGYDSSTIRRALYGNPQILQTDFIRNSLGWTLVSGCFVADKAYDYLTIGNLSSENSTLLIKNDKVKYYYEDRSILNSSYYFIDDVSVLEYLVPPLIVSSDTSICMGKPVQLEASGPDFIWWSNLNSPNDTLIKGSKLNVSPHDSTSYLVRGELNFKGCTYNSDTLTINIFPPSQLELGKDTSICVETSIQYNVPLGFVNPIWNDTLNSNAFTINHAGSYWLSAQDQYGCIYSDTVKIKMIDLPKFSLGTDVLLCNPFSLNINPIYDHYYWQDGRDTSVYYIHKTGSYAVEVVNRCGQTTDSIVVTSIDDILIPNLITPNGDSKNDCFEIKGVSIEDKGLFRVYNAWGNVVYENYSYDNSWSGEGLDAGVYYYFYSYSCFENKGWVQVVK